MTPRERLLAATIDHVAAHGIGDLSLRQLAAAIGTSHRMLVYHFGSKEGLLVEVVRTVEARQRQALADLDDGSPPAEQARRMWRRLADPAMWPLERLFFELYGQALQGRAHTTELLDGIVEDMVRPVAEALVRQGHPADEAPARARLGVAVVRGLLLDLLATGDRAAVDAAMELFISSYEQLVGDRPGPRPTGPATSAPTGGSAPSPAGAYTSPAAGHDATPPTGATASPAAGDDGSPALADANRPAGESSGRPAGGDGDRAFGDHSPPDHPAPDRRGGPSHGS